MKNDDSNERPQARSDISVQVIGDEVMLYDSAGEKIHVLNHSAHAIWKMCDGSNTLDDILRQMKREYPDAGDAIDEDIRSALDVLKDKGLLA